MTAQAAPLRHHREQGGDATTYLPALTAPVSVSAVSNVLLCSGYVPAPRTIHTFAGIGAPGFGGDLGPAPFAGLNLPGGVAVGDGALYIADTDNHRVRRVNLSTCAIDTVAGTGLNGTRETAA